jgi:hypothetical protein
MSSRRSFATHQKALRTVLSAALFMIVWRAVDLREAYYERVIVRNVGAANLVDVLDRVLDKGIVIESCVRVLLVGPASGPTSADRSAWTVRRDDDSGSGSSGSAGAPALLGVQPQPRRHPPAERRRTRGG